MYFCGSTVIKTRRHTLKNTKTIIPIALILIVFLYLMYQKGENCSRTHKRPIHTILNVDSIIRVTKLNDSVYYTQKAQRQASKLRPSEMDRTEVKYYYSKLVANVPIIIHDTTYIMSGLDSCQQIALMYSIDYDICAEQLMDCEEQMDKKNKIIEVLGKSLKLTQEDVRVLEGEKEVLLKKSKRLKLRMAAIAAAVLGYVVLK